VFETLAVEFTRIFDAPFIMRWVNVLFLFVYARNSWMNKEQSYKVPVLGQNCLQLHI